MSMMTLIKTPQLPYMLKVGENWDEEVLKKREKEIRKDLFG